MGGKKEASGNAQLGDCWCEEPVEGKLEAGILGDRLGLHICLSLVGPKLKQGQKLGKLPTLSQVLATWGLLSGQSLGFLNHYRRLCFDS